MRQKIIALLVVVFYVASPVYAEREEPRSESSAEEMTERPLVVPLQEEGLLSMIPFYKKPLFWATVTAIVAAGVWCGKNCKPDPPTDVRVILE